MTEALFTSACRERLSKAIKLVEERGSQYGDTIKDCQWLIMKSAFNKIMEHWWKFNSDTFLTTETARALAIAGLCDIKYQRFQGGYKADNIDDGINYQSILPEMIELAIKSYDSTSVSAGQTEQPQKT